MQALRSLPRAAALSARAFSTTTPRALAKMQIIGRLADQPECLPSSTGREVSKFALGVNTGPRDEHGNRATSWFNVASFMEDGPQRDLLLSLPKGTQMFVEAEAKMDSYEVDGNRRTALNLVMRNFETLSRPQSAREPSDSRGPSGGPESDKDSAAEEPLSGVGQS
ncbi:ssDNA-binding protein, mitochondrial [Saxophila tyrrhenica]|uniref:SsDNA-binding protein, mitochondrial n=1 Tax=Saxophila tyrrhenica TaxID=1690608 RepID=A0AAV9P5K2_9PEZI|nr:ssDNA-binding protein, mitochondrial [Saxophila tyrrhenica]